MAALGLGLGLGLLRSPDWYLSDGYKADGFSPSLIADFANNRYAANSSAKNFSDILTFTRGSTGTYFDSSGVMQTAAADVPRFDCDPATGVAKGLLVEGSRTNYVTNNTSVSAVSGVLGSGGSLPSGWGHNLRGLSLQITRDVDPQGIPSVRLRFSGIPSSTGSVYVTFNPNNTTTTLNGDSWTNSFYARLVSGDWTNTTSQQTIVNVFSSGLSWLQTICVSSVGGLSSVLTRYTGTGTVSNASAAYVQPLFQMNVTSGLAVNVEFDIGGIQIEKASFASSLIPTSGSAATRAADIVTNTSSNTVPFASWYNQSEGTVVAKFKGIGGDASYPRVYEISDGTSGNRHTINLFSTTRNISLGIFNGGVFQASRDSVISGLAAATAALAYNINNFAFSVNGDAPTTDTSGTPPTVTKLNIGSHYANGDIFFGAIKELLFYPIRVTNSEMQRITT